MPSTANDTILIVAPWLEGGGAQRALEQLILELPRERVHLVTLFRGCRNHASVRDLCGQVTAFDYPRNAWGVVRASISLRHLIRRSRTVYSLMRASHVVLGLVPAKAMASRRLAATFHQLPSAERSGPVAVAEEAMIRRGLTAASLVTTPALAALEEITERGLCRVDCLIFEPNRIREQPTPLGAIRTGHLSVVRLLFAGRLMGQKGLERIPELLAASTTPLWIRIVGDGPDEGDLRLILGKVPAPHRVELLSRTENVTPLIDWSDAGFMPSRYELSPVFVWEAWQRGRSVLGSKIPAFTELARHGPVLTFATPDEFAEVVRIVAGSSYRRSAEAAGPDAVATANRRSELVEFLAG